MVRFGPHAFQTEIIDIVQARQLDLINKPERREKDDTAYTPTVVTFKCTSGKLHFVLEDIAAIAETLKGISFHFSNETQVTFTCL